MQMKKWIMSLMMVGALVAFAPVSDAGEGCCPGGWSKDKSAKVEKAKKDYMAKAEKSSKDAKGATCEVKADCEDKAGCDEKAACDQTAKK
jgi:hypothetical protein